jgi:23S rRNA (pseudouridine1915-N3)-methyltransferase
MIKINIIAVGKVKEKYFEDGIKEYIKRISRFADINIKELKEENIYSPTSGEIEQIIKKESESILKEFKGYVVALAIEGKKLTSEKLSQKINEIAAYKSGEISFIIGGSYGLSKTVKEKADFLLSLSDMTFPHTLFRLMLTEQIYRAFTISNNVGYHK